MTTNSMDIKPLMERVEQDLLDRPSRMFIKWGIGLVALGAAVIILMAKGPDEYAEYGDRYDGLAAIVALAGVLCIVAAIMVRILQRGRRDEIRRELHRELGVIETERARRDMRLMEIIEPLADMVRRNGFRIEDTAGAVDDMRNEFARTVKQARAEAYVDTLNGVGSVVRFPKRLHDGAEQDDR